MARLVEGRSRYANTAAHGLRKLEVERGMSGKAARAAQKAANKAAGEVIESTTLLLERAEDDELAKLGIDLTDDPRSWNNYFEIHRVQKQDADLFGVAEDEEE